MTTPPWVERAAVEHHVQPVAVPLAARLDPFVFRQLYLTAGKRPPTNPDWLRSEKAPRPEHHSFSELNTSELVLASFGETALADPIGFVWETDPSPGSTTLFGTQHIITDQWVRLGSRFAGDLAHFLDPSCRDRHWLRLVIRSLASFEGRRNWLRSGKTPHSEHHSFSEPNASELVLASFGETVRAVGRTSSIGTNCQRAAHARPPTSSSGGRRERVSGIRLERLTKDPHPGPLPEGEGEKPVPSPGGRGLG
jgi:hypothetical protein